jgi:protein involved in polysaccharide export with SLBB domain
MPRVFAFALVLILSIVCFAQTADQAIKPGDRLTITCDQDESLNRIYKVTEDGLIMVPFLGAVRVEGATTAYVADDIEKRLIEGRVLKEADVTVLFVGQPVPPKPIKVQGAVSEEGEVSWKEGMRLSDVLRSITPGVGADFSRIRILSLDSAVSIVNFSKFDPGTNAQNPVLRPGDTVVISTKGEPKKPVKSGPDSKTPPVKKPPVKPVTKTETPPVTKTETPPVKKEETPPVKPKEEPKEEPKAPVFVLGGIVEPGSVAWSKGLTIRSAIRASGGFTDQADTSRVRIERKNVKAKVYNLTDRALDAPLLPGDQVIVEVIVQKRFLTIDGAVNKPGIVKFRDGLTLTQAIQAAGGFMKSAKKKVIKITRRDGNKSFFVNFEEIERGYRGEPELRPGDSIEIPGAPNRLGKIIRTAAVPALLIFLIGS